MDVNPEVVPGKKKNKGKRKIDIKRIEEETSRQVAFTKRRSGLFKKAAEICVLTGAQVAILVTSTAGRVFAFRHPKSDVVFDDFLHHINNNNKEEYTTNKKYSPLALPLVELNQHYEEVSRELEAEKKRGGMIPVNNGGGLRWFDEAVDGLDVEELKEYLWSLGELKKKVLTRADELMIINNSSSSSYASALFASSNNNNNNFLPVDKIPITNTGFDGGFRFQYAGDDGNF